MSTTIRDINGNKLKQTLRHASTHVAGVSKHHTDSTGLFVSTYYDDKYRGFSAFVRPETVAEYRYVEAAKIIGKDDN